MVDFGSIFGLQAGFLEMIVRGTAIYWALFVLLRLAGRRDIGSLGTADLLVLVLVADAAGSALSGESSSVGDGIIVVITIVAWSVLLDRAGYYIPCLRRLLEPSRVCLIRDGKVVPSGLRSEYITRGELMEQLRLKGVESYSSVKRAYLESTGEFSVITVGAKASAENSALDDI